MRSMRRLLTVLLVLGVCAANLAYVPNSVQAWKIPDLNTNAWSTNGEVRAIVQAGDVFYIGGDFNFIGPYTGS